MPFITVKLMPTMPRRHVVDDDYDSRFDDREEYFDDIERRQRQQDRVRAEARGEVSRWQRQTPRIASLKVRETHVAFLPRQQQFAPLFYSIIGLEGSKLDVGAMDPRRGNNIEIDHTEAGNGRWSLSGSFNHRRFRAAFDENTARGRFWFL